MARPLRLPYIHPLMARGLWVILFASLVAIPYSSGGVAEPTSRLDERPLDRHLDVVISQMDRGARS